MNLTMDDYLLEMFTDLGRGGWVDVLCVDPGLGGTGLAQWDRLKKPVVVPTSPEIIHPISPPRKLPWWEKVDYIADEFVKFLLRNDPRHVVIEWQEVWASSAKSMASATKGEIFKTALVAGQLSREVRNRTGRRAILVTPTQWKGQLSKKAIKRRLQRAFGDDYHVPDHVEDAVGMGLAIQGRL